MRTLVVIVVSVAVTWIVANVYYGIRTGTERLWLVSAVKAPGHMALADIQAEMDAGHYQHAKAQIDILMDTWRRFESGPDSCRGPGIGDIMVSFSKLETNSLVAHP